LLASTSTAIRYMFISLSSSHLSGSLLYSCLPTQPQNSVILSAGVHKCSLSSWSDGVAHNRISSIWFVSLVLCQKYMYVITLFSPPPEKNRTMGQ